jgi:hypothetical protein
MKRHYRIVYSETVMRLDLRNDHTLKIVMVEPVASLTLKNVVAGRLYVFLFEQSDTNPTTTFICPQMLNKAPISFKRNTVTGQMFVGLTTGQMAATMPGSNYRPS